MAGTGSRKSSSGSQVGRPDEDGRADSQTESSLTPFAQRLRARARHLGLSDAEVARRAGLGQPRYSNYSNGIREPDLATLVAVATALETTPDRLLGITDGAVGTDPSDRALAAQEGPAAALCQDLADLVRLMPPERLPLAVALLRAVLHDADADGRETAKAPATAALADGLRRPPPAGRRKASKLTS